MGRGQGVMSMKKQVKVKLLSRARLSVTPWTIAHQAPLCPWDFPGKNTGVGSSSRGSS